jgi:hypothetical protein
VDIPQRSLADAARYDDVVVVHRRGADKSVRRWIQCLNDILPAAERNLALLRHPPQEVEIIATRWDGIWQLRSRYPIEIKVDGLDSTPPGESAVPSEWNTTTWPETSHSCDVRISLSDLDQQGINR